MSQLITAGLGEEDGYDGPSLLITLGLGESEATATEEDSTDTDGPSVFRMAPTWRKRRVRFAQPESR